MSIRRMGIVFGLALVVGSILSMWLPESESTIEEQVFNEITYQMSELKLVTAPWSRHETPLTALHNASLMLHCNAQQTGCMRFNRQVPRMRSGKHSSWKSGIESRVWSKSWEK